MVALVELEHFEDIWGHKGDWRLWKGGKWVEGFKNEMIKNM